MKDGIFRIGNIAIEFSKGDETDLSAMVIQREIPGHKVEMLGSLSGDAADAMIDLLEEYKIVHDSHVRWCSLCPMSNDCKQLPTGYCKWQVELLNGGVK